MSLFGQGFEIIDNFISPSHADAILAQISELEHIVGSECSNRARGVRNINKKLSSFTAFLLSAEFLSKLNPFCQKTHGWYARYYLISRPSQIGL
jgi:hypothetical protein